MTYLCSPEHEEDKHQWPENSHNRFSLRYIASDQHPLKKRSNQICIRKLHSDCPRPLRCTLKNPANRMNTTKTVSHVSESIYTFSCCRSSKPFLSAVTLHLHCVLFPRHLCFYSVSHNVSAIVPLGTDKQLKMF